MKKKTNPKRNETHPPLELEANAEPPLPLPSRASKLALASLKDYAQNL